MNKIIRKCEICSKIFLIWPSRLKRKGGRFCSKICSGKFFYPKRKKYLKPPRGKKIERKCQFCKKNFHVIPSIAKNGFGIFCSKKCKDKWTSQNKKGKNSFSWKGGKLERNCEYCKEKIKVYPSRIKIGSGRFCSLACKAFWEASHNNKRKDTSIELLVEKQLKKENISYLKQKAIKKIAVPDFLIGKIIIFCDGDYWHNLPGRQQRDKKQNKLLKLEGYKVFRLWEHKIKNEKLLALFINKLKKYL